MAVIEKSKSEPVGKKIPNLERYCPQLCLRTIQTMRSSPETKRKKKKSIDNTNSTKEGNSDDMWKCKSCKEIRHGQDDDENRWIVCDACDGNYHLQCSGIYYDEEPYYEIEIENKLFLCVEYE